jgi:pentose-5-phosphate-3-epimerase
VDGGIDIRNLNDVLAAGADVIVAGSAIFNDRVNAFDALREMKTISDRYSDQLEVV